MKNRTLAIWPQTHKIFRLLAAESGRPIIELLHEAAELLRAHYAANAAAAEVSADDDADKSYPLAA